MNENANRPTAPRSTVQIEPATTNITEAQTLEPVRTLTCCCCGESTRGRQWWNRDTGFVVSTSLLVLFSRRNEPSLLSNPTPGVVRTSPPPSQTHYEVETMIPMSLQEASLFTNSEVRGEYCALIQIIGRMRFWKSSATPVPCPACGQCC
jgi:hypothetical protein